MYIKWIEVKNYRNLKDVLIHFHDKVNYIVGENAVGKSNFLALLQLITFGGGFQESDFFSPTKPIRVRLCLARREEKDEQIFSLEQHVQEIYPHLYAETEGNRKREEVPLERLRLLLYLNHETRQKDMPKQYRDTYNELIKKFRHNYSMDKEKYANVLKNNTFFTEQISESDENFEQLVQSVTLMLTKEEGEHCFTTDNLKLITMVALKLLLQIYEMYVSVALNLQHTIEVTRQGKRLLPIFISIDEPEIHLNPYLQRAVLSYYRELINNESSGFVRLLKDLFDIDGLSGQIFIVTHSTDALVDDYRNIIRFFRDAEGNVRSISGVEFHFSKEVEKHLIMHFPEIKEALYARSVLIVEGETEFGSFTGFGKTCGVNFDYYGICLVNARGESSISKLASLFHSFEIPAVMLYDRDVKEKYSGGKNCLFTDEICFEMDVATHLLKRRKHHLLMSVVADVTENSKGMVTKEMLRKGLAKLGLDQTNYRPRALKNISERQIDDMIIYFFSWLYGSKGVVVGKSLAAHLEKEDIPPAFVRVIERARILALRSVQKKV